MLKTAPDPIDVQDLQFKLRCRLKVFDNTEGTNFPQPCNLITCASRFGLIFVGANTAYFQVIQLKHLEEYSKNDGDKTDYPRRQIPIPSPPKFLSVNCEHTILCVIVEKNNCPFALFYDVKSFWQKDFVLCTEIRLSPTPGVNVVDVNWNPALGAIFTACKSDGTLGIYELKNPGVDINELPAAAGATCFCWSPKGKQIAIGSRDGKITQYKPDLKAVKVISAPPLKEPHLLLSLQWISNYQFIGMFSPISSNNQASLIVIDAPKTGETTYINYDDICYSNGNTRPSQFYMITQQHWNLLMVASSNSMEVGILGHSNEIWTQWIMGDAARAELPLTADHQETLPVGFGLDIGCMQQLQWGESTLPPCPILLILSHSGTLCCFNVVNLKEGVPNICSPPELLKETTGLDCFVSKTELKQNIPEQSTTQVSKTTLPKTTKNVSSSSTVFEISANNSANKPSELIFSTTQASNMFGGQTTLIPVSQVNKNVTSAPQLLHPTTYASMPSTFSNENKAVTIAAPIQKSSTSFFSKEPQLSVTSLTNTNVPKIVHSKPKEDLSSRTDANIDLKPEEEAETLFAQMVKEECAFLETELKVILHQGKTLKLNLGTDGDKNKIIETTKSIQDFLKELVDICTTQNSEVHILKQNLLQSWAWYEEVKSRYAASKDESMMILLRAQPLDSASEKQLEDIRHVNYYLESQIAQAHRALDEQWENFQDYCKKTHKMQIPTMEIIFQTMVKQNAILRKQNYVLKDIGSRIKSKSRSAVGSSLLLSVEDSKDLSDELKRLRLNPSDICQLQYEHVVNRTKNFTKKKIDTLRSFLKRKEYPHISAVKPQLSTSVIQVSPSTKVKSINLGDTRTSPLIRGNVSKKLEFAQSTPKVPFVKPQDLNETTPIEGLQNFTLKFEAKNFSKLPNEQTFMPLNKNMIASSPNSAFVATTFGTAVSTSISTSSSFKPVIFGTSTATVTKPQSNFMTVTTSSVDKPQSNLLSTTLSSESPISINSGTNLSKQFSFTSATTVFQQDTTNTNISKPAPTTFLNASAGTLAATSGTTKPAFSFTAQPINIPKSPSVTTGSAFGKTETKNVPPKPPSTSVFDATSKPISTTSPAYVATTLTKPVSTTPVTLTNFSYKNSTIFGTASTTATTSNSPFSINTNMQNIFGTPSEKPESLTVTKPFVFTSVTPTKPTNAANVATVTQSRTTSANTTQSVLFFSPQSTPSDASKTVISTQSLTSSVSAPSVVITPKTQMATSSTISSTSIFGSNQFSAKPSTPGTFMTGTNTTQNSVFGTPVSSVSTQPSIFGATSKPSIFGNAPVSATVTTMVSTSSTPVTTSSVTPSVSATSTSAVTTTTTSVQAPASVTVAFGATTTSQTSIFGSPAASANTSQTSSFTPVGFSFANSAFGSTPTTKPISFGGTDDASKPSIFGSAPTSTAASVFGTTTTSTTPTLTSVFGTSIAPTASQQSVFGSVSSSTTTQSQIFGSFGDTTQKKSIFGSTAPTNSTQSSIFGSNQNTVFGGATTTANSTFKFNDPKTTQSIFGQSSGFGSSGSSFGNTGGGNIFGTAPTAFGQSGGSVFGGTTTTTSGSIFGATSTSSNVFGSNNSVFGAPTSSTTSVFGSGNVFSSTTQSTPFVANTSSTTFGFGNLNVGSTPSTSGSVFGATQTSNPFGGGNKNIFGSSSGSTPTSSVFGSNTGSPFGSPTQQSFGNSFGQSGGSQSSFFGQQSTFGQSAFGGSSFGQQNTGGPFSSGGPGSVAQSGFGGSPTFQKPGGFGSSPVFGSSPSFGSAPSFGGAPTFGNTATFGSPPKIFGSGTSTFGTPANTQNSSFGNLANQPTVGFGNLAQQAANAPAPSAPFTGSSSFSSWR